MTGRRYSFFIGLLWIPSILAGQQAFVDSLRLLFHSEKDLVRKIDIFYEIANEQSLDNPKMGMAYADSLERMAREAGYERGLAMAKHVRGFAYDDQGEYEKALALFQEELEIFIRLKDKKEQSTAYTNLGSVWGNLGQQDSAIFYYLRSLALDEALGDSLGASINHNNIGNIYSDEGVYDKAIQHFQKSLEIRQKMGVEKRYLQCYSNLATVYSRMKDYEKAETYGLKALEYALKFENLAWAGIITNTLGTNQNDQLNFSEALPWLEQALGYWEKIENEAYQTYAHYNLAVAYAGLGQGTKAIDHAKRGFAIVEKLQLEHQYELYYKAFALAYEADGDVARAFEWYKKYVGLADSLFKLENTRKVAQMEAQFESKKKEAQIAQQQLKIEHQANQKNRILIGAVLMLLLLTGFFQFIRYKQKAKQKEIEMAAKLEHAEVEKFRALDQMKSTFFANISHEFRTPLTLILSPIEQMLDQTFRGDYQKYYGIIHRNGKRLLDLVNQLLDLSKLESGNMQLETSLEDLGRFVSTLAGSFESLAVRQQINFLVEVPADPFVCWFDRDKVEKILVNLISNAFKFTSEGGQISVVLKKEDHLAILEVRDTGIGIPAEILPHIFERFSKTSFSEVQAGSGIGLALTRELILLHRGDISVQSIEGNGSSFKVVLETGDDLPRSNQAVEGPSPHLKISSNNSSFQTIQITKHSILDTSGKPIVLVAEDNADLRHYIADTLAHEFKIVEAADGKMGLEKAFECTPDLIITDVMMPHMDGLEFCQQLKTSEKTSHIPVVMLTARSDQADKLAGLEKGADDYLLKPFHADELKVRIRNLIEQRKTLQEYFRQTLHALAPKAPDIGSVDAIFLNRIKQEIEANLEDERFSVVELASRMRMSRSQLHRKLSALTSYSPNEVIRNMRLERARQLLEKNAGSVAEISYLCGFSSPAYFNKCFKDYFGSTPGNLS